LTYGYKRKSFGRFGTIRAANRRRRQVPAGMG
jgi:hypothetical protein